MEVVVRFCKNCNCDTERKSNGRCKACAKEYLYKWRKENPEKFRAIQDSWDAKNADRLKQAARALYEKSRGEKIAYSKEYYEKNKEAIKPRKKQWQMNNLDSCRLSDQNRRAAKLNCGGRLSSGLKEKLFTLQKGKCACCGLPLGEKYHLDHIMPLALGGSNTDDNIQLLRQRCNNQKHAKHPVDFMQSRGFLL